MSSVQANFMSSHLGRICGKVAGGHATACGEVAMRRDLVVPCTGAQRAGDRLAPLVPLRLLDRSFIEPPVLFRG
jgi:hypothetical protein